MGSNHSSAFAAGIVLSVFSRPGRAEYGINLPPPESSVAQTSYDLHILLLWVCFAIFVVVFGAMFYALLKHRKSLGHEAHPFHESTAVEVVWTAIPFLILIGIAWPASKAVLAQKDTRNPDLTIEVTGRQWKWEYNYLQEGVKFLSVLATPQDQIDGRSPKDADYLLEVDEPMVVPVGRKVRILTTSTDVIHSWWVPALGVKQDSIPGFIRDTWFRADQLGTFRGQCAELCGNGHAFMPIVVKVVGEADYRAWLADKKARAEAAQAAAGKSYGQAELMKRGEKVFTDNCAACHQASGMGIPGAFPSLVGDKVVTGDKTGHIAMVLNGRPGTAMPAFGPQLPDLDIAAVLTYERNSWGNQAGVVQPADVLALRQK